LEVNQVATIAALAWSDRRGSGRAAPQGGRNAVEDR